MSEATGDTLRAARSQVLAGSLTGSALREELTRVVDAWLFRRLGEQPGAALVAVGGYGRREPAPHSDLDLVLLHRDRADVAAVAGSLWYPIWDAGLRLDHSVRTVDEALAVAGADLKTALGLLDVRHVCGEQALTDELREKVRLAWRRGARDRLPELAAAVRSRTERSGEMAFLLEPDLKESRGGMRDVHAMTAIAAAWVTDAPPERVRTAYQWVLDVRTELQRRSARSNDRLVQQEHAPVAHALGVDPELLLRRLSEAARTIQFATDEACRRALQATQPPRRRRRGTTVRRPLADDVVEQDGEVHLARDARPATDPGLVLRVAASAAQHGLPIAPYTMHRLASEGMPLPVPWPGAARDDLVATLGAGPPAVAVLEALDQAGMLVRLLPEWEQVRCKPQHSPVHRYTVDRHLIETAAAAAALTRRVARPDLLLLAALLHDIGKGWPGDHTAAGIEVIPALAARIGLDPTETQLLLTLVRHHLLLPDTATRRDLDDPATVEAVVAAVGDRATLELLHALTEADASATGPGAWGEWKAGLVADLVRRAAAVLGGEPPPRRDPLDPAQQALATAGEVAVERTGPRITVVAPDRPGLLWRWAAVMALHRSDIRSATAVTVPAADGRPMAVSVFDVAPRFGSYPDLDALRNDIRRGYEDPAPLEHRLLEREKAYASQRAPAVAPVVRWVDEASRTATVVEVRAHDGMGLLYRLTRALCDAGLDVRSAQINTAGAEVVDAFYVVDADGQPLRDTARRDAVERSLLAASQAS